MRIRLENCRLAYPQLFVPTAYTGTPKAGEENSSSAPKYSARLLFDKKGELHKKVHETCVKVAIEKWGPKDGPEMFRTFQLEGRLCLRNGDAKPKSTGFKGRMFVSANSLTKPRIVDRGLKDISSDNGLFHSGCYVNAVIDIYGQKTFSGRISAELVGIQYVGPGEEVWGGSGAPFDPTEAFEPLAPVVGETLEENDDEMFSAGGKDFEDDEIPF